jgi:hypothetical protein
MSLELTRTGRRRCRIALELLEDRRLLSIGFTMSNYYVNDQSSSVTLGLFSQVDGPAGLPPATTTPAANTFHVQTQDVSAKAGVDYTAVNTTAQMSSDPASQVVTIPLLKGSGNTSERTFTVQIAPASTDPTVVSTATVHVVNRTDLTPPTVVAARELAKGRKLTGVVITFTKAMNPVPVQNPSNYAIVDLLRSRANPARESQQQYMSSLNSALVPVSQSVYDPNTHSVTITPAKPMRTSLFLMVVDPRTFSTNGPPPVSPITDSVGNPLDSLGTGVPDGILNIRNVAPPSHIGRGGKLIPGFSVLGAFA